MSSAWALGQVVVLGLGSDGRTARNLGERPDRVLSLPGPDLWREVELLSPLTGRAEMPEERRGRFRPWPGTRPQLPLRDRRPDLTARKADGEQTGPQTAKAVVTLTGMPSVRTALETTLSASNVFNAVCDLYAAVFGSPPISHPPAVLESQRASLRSLMAEPAFGMATAWHDDQLVGFIYGHALREDTHWWDDPLTPIPEEITREHDGRTFAVIDLGVAHSYQKQGIGRALLQTLLEARPEQRATLAVEIGNEPAHGFYRHLGWQYVARFKGAPHHTAPFFDIYLLKLR